MPPGADLVGSLPSMSSGRADGRAQAVSEADMDPDAAAMAEREMKAAFERARSMQRFTQMVVEKRRQAIDARASSGVETRWLEDMNNYHGLDANARRDMFSESLRNTSTVQQKAPHRNRRATLFVQVPRQRTNTAAARFGEKLFPSDEMNWELQPTPVPELNEAALQARTNHYKDPKPGPTQGQVLNHPVTGKPLTVGDVVADAKGQIKARTKKMEKVIADQLTECGYNREGRKAIKDAAMLGTGILKGPVIANSIDKRYVKRMTTDGKVVHVLQRQRVAKPISRRVDPWNFYPAPGCGEDVHAGSHCFEREEISPQGLRDLANVPGYDKSMIAQCLRETPQRWQPTGSADSARRTVDGYIDTRTYNTNTFELWTYTGDISIDDMRLFGIDPDGEHGDASDEAVLGSMSAVVVMCNDHVIRVETNPMETGDLPYDVFNWETVPGSPWGVGVPYLWRYASQTINAGWRAMLDNAGMAHGPQVVINTSLIEPMDRSYDIHGRKLWRAKAGVDDVSKAFTIFNIPTQQEMMQNIINMAMKFGDEESSTPAMMQGEPGVNAPDKVGIVQMLMNAANVVLSAQAKNWDDMITAPHLRRYYDWNMQYHPDESIKGDMEVHPRGSTHLIVRDQQKQDIANLLSFAGNPMFEKYVHPERLFAKAAAASSMGDVMRTPDEVVEWEQQQQDQPPPMEPTVEAAKIRAQAAIDAEKVEAESEQMNLKLRAESEKRDDEREIYKMQLEAKMMMLKYAQENQMQLRDVQAQLSMMVMNKQAEVRKQEVQAAQDLIGSYQAPETKEREAVPA